MARTLFVVVVTMLATFGVNHIIDLAFLATRPSARDLYTARHVDHRAQGENTHVAQSSAATAATGVAAEMPSSLSAAPAGTPNTADAAIRQSSAENAVHDVSVAARAADGKEDVTEAASRALLSVDTKPSASGSGGSGARVTRHRCHRMEPWGASPVRALRCLLYRDCLSVCVRRVRCGGWCESRRFAMWACAPACSPCAALQSRLFPPEIGLRVVFHAGDGCVFHFAQLLQVTFVCTRTFASTATRSTSWRRARA